MNKLIPATLIAALSFTLANSVLAETPGNIASLCKKQWPGEKGQQSYCIKEKRNYQEWLKYNRKRVFANADARLKIDECVAENKPDYRAAYDCVFDSSWF